MKKCFSILLILVLALSSLSINTAEQKNDNPSDKESLFSIQEFNNIYSNKDKSITTNKTDGMLSISEYNKVYGNMPSQD